MRATMCLAGASIGFIFVLDTTRALKVWLDALTPKQLLFSEYVMRRAGDAHSFLFTSRDYHEVTGLADIRGLRPRYAGKFGGGDLASKLDASLERAALLSGMVQEFGPDVSVAFGSPEASRVSFGLAIPHIGFCNSPHAEAASRLAIPLSARLLIPDYIPKHAVSIFGIGVDDVIQYKALDEVGIIQNPPAPWDPASVGIMPGRKTILFRAYETQASYIERRTDTDAIISSLARNFPACNVVVSGRYPDQIRQLRRNHEDCIVLEGPVDGGALLECCDTFVGSGGTMTTEAVLRGVPSVSYHPVTTLGESYLVDKGALRRARAPGEVTREVGRLLEDDPATFADVASNMLSDMEDPYDVLQDQMDAVTRR